MKKIRVLSIIITLIMVLNIIAPTTFAISENLINQQQGADYVRSYDEDLLNNGNANNNLDLTEESIKENINEEDKANRNELNEENRNESNEEVDKETSSNGYELIEEDEQNKETQSTKEIVTYNMQNEIQLTSNIAFSAYVETNGYKIGTYLSKGIYYLFVPKAIDIRNLAIKYQYGVDIKQVSSGTIDNVNKIITNNFENNDTLKILANDNTNYTIKVMQSDIPSICINLKNDVSLQTVHAGSKDIKYDASMQIIGATDNSYNISDNNIQFKGRGNSTWKMDKRGYQIKLDKKQNLLGIGNGKSKKWVLLANQADRTLLRNKIAYDLGVETDLTNIPNSTFVDLYVNGEYIGNYQLSDKVETGSSRVNLTNEKGVLVELDNEYGRFEPLYFTTKGSKTTFALKESYAGDNDLGETAEKAALKSFENSINQFETSLNANANWEQIKKIIDVQSFAKLYLVMELSENPDALYSSTYFYKDGDNDIIHAGPVWDFDAAFGYYKSDYKGGNYNTDFLLNHRNTWYTKLFQYNQFVALVNDTYNKEIKTKFHNINSKIDTHIASMPKSIKMNFVRWDYLLGNTFENPTTTPNGTTYESEVKYMKNWISKRIAYMDNRYSISSVLYQGHIQDYGWDNIKKDGQTVGTVGQSKRIEALRISLPTEDKNVHIKYQAHVQDIGWQNWVQDGQLAGTEGQCKRVEGIRIKIEGMPDYSVMYRVHIQNIGWQDWKYNGEFAGTEGQCLRIEALEIKVMKTNYLGSKQQSQTAKINYRAHIQNIGWSGWGQDSQMIGTQGMNYRLEGINIHINSRVLQNTNISYQVHIQDYGWQDWRQNGAFAGTEGACKRLEAIRIKLDNPKYSVKYRTHIQNVGWGPWVADGQMSGTEGQCKRLEAIQIEIVEK